MTIHPDIYPNNPLWMRISALDPKLRRKTALDFTASGKPLSADAEILISSAAQYASTQDSIDADSLTLRLRRCSSLARHDLAKDAVLDYASMLDKLGDKPDDAQSRLSILWPMARLLTELGRYDVSRLALERTITDSTRVFGPHHDQTLQARGNHAAVLLHLGQYTKALEALTGLLTRQRGSAHAPPTWIRLTRAAALVELGRYDEALAEQNACIDDLTNSSTPDANAVLQARAGRAATLSRIGRYADALADEEAVAAGLTRLFGERASETLRANYQACCTMTLLGQSARALNRLDAILDPAEAVLGTDHPDTLNIRGRRAVALEDLGRYAEALKEHDTVIRSLIKVSHIDHPDVLAARANRTIALEQSGDIWGALRELEDLVEAFARVRGPLHPTAIRIRCGRAITLNRVGRTDDALAEELWAIRAFGRTIGTHHPETIRARSTHASTLAEVGRVGEALSERQWVATAFAQTLGPSHPDTLNARRDLATILAELGHNEEALAEYDALLQSYESTTGPESPNVIHLHRLHATVLARLGRFSEALAEFDFAISQSRITFGEMHLHTIETLIGRASTLADAGRPGEAFEELDRAIHMYADVLGPGHPFVGYALVDQASLGRFINEDSSFSLSRGLRGLAILDHARYLLRDARDREAWRHRYSRSLGAILEIAASDGDGRLVAELLETARLQSVPGDPDDATFHAHSHQVASAPAAERIAPVPSEPNGLLSGVRGAVDAVRGLLDDHAILDPLGRPPIVTVGGRSQLDEASFVSRDRPRIALEEIAGQLAPPGPRLVWWSSFLAGGALHQVVLTIASSGTTQVMQTSLNWRESGLDRHVAKLDHLRSNWFAWDRDSNHPYTTPLGYALTLHAIAAILLPETLRTILIQAADEGEELWLLVSPAPELARVPFSTLPFLKPRRLGSRVGPEAVNAPSVLDTCVVQHAAPVAVTWAAANRFRDRGTATTAVARGIGLSIVDPSDDADTTTRLVNAKPHPTARRVLAGPHMAEVLNVPVATKEATIAALSRLNGEVVHLAAHSTDGSRPGDCGIRLARDEFLTARDILRLSEPIRSRGIVTACCGTLDNHTPEWLGLAPAMLLAGFDAVYATLWPIGDTPPLTRLEHELAELLDCDEHPAKSLTHYQRLRYSEFRQQGSAAGHPLDYAAFTTLARTRLDCVSSQDQQSCGSCPCARIALSEDMRTEPGRDGRA
jgi:tetratricopeptide (TPR) repeat protein